MYIYKMDYHKVTFGERFVLEPSEVAEEGGRVVERPLASVVDERGVRGEEPGRRQLASNGEQLVERQFAQARRQVVALGLVRADTVRVPAAGRARHLLAHVLGMRLDARGTERRAAQQDGALEQT